MISKLDSTVSQTGPSGFDRFKTEGYIEDYHAQNGSGILQASRLARGGGSRADEGTKDEGRSSRKGER
jgi:hypothetical protein